MNKTGTTETRIDEMNCSLWRSRYDDTAATLTEAKSVLAKSQKAKYQKGMAYARLNIAACSFLQSKNDVALGKSLRSSFMVCRKWF
jgi:hypothetical protein